MENYSQGKNVNNERGGNTKNDEKGLGGNKDSNKKEQKKFFVQRITDSFFAIMLELLKNKQIGEKYACLVIFVMFLQLYSTLFDGNIFPNWEDQFFLSYIQTLASYLHIHGAIDNSGSSLYYLLLFYIAIVYQFVMTGLIIYLHYALKYRNILIPKLVQLLQLMLLLSLSVLVYPFCDHLTSAFKCKDGYHYLMTNLQCYSTEHTIMLILAGLSLILFFIINLMTATYYNETQPVKEDALARLDSNFEWIMLCQRMVLSIVSIFCSYSYCQWIIVIISLMSSIYYIYQYYKFLPYYNSNVSLTFGAMLGLYFWVSLNTVFQGFWQVNGQITCILLGIPVAVYVMKRTREHKIEWLMITNLEKLTNDIDCLNQVMTLQEWLEECQKTNSDINKEIKVKGFINQHMYECENSICICQRISELYDQNNNTYLSMPAFGLEAIEDVEDFENDEEDYRQPSWQKNKKKRVDKKMKKVEKVVQEEKHIIELHRSEVFINNFNRQLYTDALQKFVGSVSIHILFAYYYFTVLKNVHAALHELKIASKKRPNLYQQFTIFRYQSMIEIFVKAEGDQIKEVYEQLTNVKEFEKIFADMSKKIEKVCNTQVEFWTHLATVIPDLNYLNSLNNQVFDSAIEVEQLWQVLCKINPSYPHGLLMYAEYQSLIRNNQEIGKEFYDKADKLSFGAKSAHDNPMTSDVLFSDETVIIHISGNKESSGRIVKSSQGLKKCFGWDRTEIIGQNVSILMPTIFARKHNHYLEQYYQTARRQMFNKERSLFASHKTGYCFSVDILIRQMPNLNEGIQYVGMIKPQITDNDYIITDINGSIDSFSSGIGLMFNINPQILKEINQFNIQFIAPELMNLFNKSFAFRKDSHRSNGNSGYKQNYGGKQQMGRQKTMDNSRFSAPGGDNLTFYIPNNFLSIIRQEYLGKNRQKSSRDVNSMGVLPGGMGGHIPNLLGMNQTNSNKQSQQFKDFLKYVTKSCRNNQSRRIPDLKQLLQCKEYRDHDIKKSLTVEIREWVIPLRNSERKGLRMLLFIIPKNQADKKQVEEQSFDRSEENQVPPTTQQSPANDVLKQSTTDIGLGKHHHSKPHHHESRVFKAASGGTTQPPLVQQKPQKTTPLSIQAQQVQRNVSFNQANSFSMKNHAIKSAISFEADQSIKNTSSNQNRELSQPNSILVAGSVRENKESQSVKLTLNEDHSQSGTKGIEKQIDPELKKLESWMAFIQRQETDDEDEDDQEQLDTERIDVKKDIALVDEMRHDNGTQSDAPFLPEVRTDQIKQLQQQQQFQKLFLDPNINELKGLITDSAGTSSIDQSKKIDRPRLGNTSQHQINPNDTSPDILETDEILTMPYGAKHQDGENEEDYYDGEEGEEGYGEEGWDEEGEYFQDEGEEDDNGDVFIEDEGEDVLEGKSQGSNEEELLVGRKSDYVQNKNSRMSRRSNRYSQKGSEYSQRGQTQQDLNQNWGTGQQQNMNQSINNLGQPQQNRKIHDYARIVTNPKYKYFDEETCGSAYFNDFNASEKEIDIRDNIKRLTASAFQRMQTRRIRKPKKVQDSTEKGDSNAQIPIGDDGKDDKGGHSGKKKRKRVNLKDDSKSQSRKSDSFEEEDLDDLDEEEGNPRKNQVQSGLNHQLDQRLQGMQQRQVPQRQLTGQSQNPNQNTAANTGSTYADEGEASSVASSIQSQTRTYYTLKLAIDEKFVPPQIRNLRFVANLVWLSIMLLSVVYFVIQSTLFSQIQSYIGIIVTSEQRIDNIMTINLKLVEISLINENITQVNGSQHSNTSQPSFTNSDLINNYLAEFLASSTALMNSQTQLSLQTSSLDEASRLKINPNGVTLQYFDTPPPNLTPNTMMPNSYIFNIWEAIIQITVCSYNLATNPGSITHQNPQMQFVFSNCMNSVLSALQESTQAIVDQSNNARQANNNTFLILLLGVSCALLLSMGFLLPVIRRAKNNKEEVFALLTLKKVEKQIEEQLKKCRWYITKYQQQHDNQQDFDEMGENNNMIGNNGNNIEENTHIPGERSHKHSNDDKKDDYILKVKKQRRKWKRLDNNFLSITLRFLLLLLLIESFFLYNYLTSQNFLSEVSLLMNELQLVISTQPALDFQLLMDKELIYSNATEVFLFKNVTDVAQSNLISSNADYQSLLDLFQSNYYYHTSLYNSLFTSIMYQSVCDNVQVVNYSSSDCAYFDEGTLNDGMYDSVIEYWDQLQSLLDTFFGSKRSYANSTSLLNYQSLEDQQIMSETFLTQGHLQLGTMLQNDINASFSSQQASNMTVFVFFLIYVILVYAIVWRIFMKGLLEELWRAKSCLQVLPVEVCFRVEEIRAFIYRNSTGFATATAT